MSFHVNLLTLFPEMFPGSLGHSLAGDGFETRRFLHEVQEDHQVIGFVMLLGRLREAEYAVVNQLFKLWRDRWVQGSSRLRDGCPVLCRPLSHDSQSIR